MQNSQPAPRASRPAPIGWRSTALLIAVALATRLITFGNPILYTDEEFYFAVGRAMVNGAWPFVDIWDRKPIGLFLLYAGPAALPGQAGIWLYQAMALACAAATALVVARLAAAAGWARGGVSAGIAYLAWITIAGGQGGQAPVFYNLLMALAALLIVDGAGRGRWRGLLAMGLVGLAIQIKYTAALEGVFFGLWLVRAEWRRSERAGTAIGWAVLLGLVALLPTLVAAGVYAEAGELRPFLYANFLSILARHPDPRGEELVNLAKAAAILGPILAMAARSRGATAEAEGAPRTFLRGWLVVALVAFALLPPWTDHYTLPVILPGVAAAAGWLGRPQARTGGAALLLIAALIGQASLVFDRHQRGTPRQFAALVRVVGRGPGCLYVYSSSSMLYPATGRCAVSPFVFPSHLTRRREEGAIGMDQHAALDRIFAAAPAVVVMGPPYQGERPEIRAAALAHLAADYRLVAENRLGRKQVAVYRLRLPRPPGRVFSRFD